MGEKLEGGVDEDRLDRLAPSGPLATTQRRHDRDRRPHPGGEVDEGCRRSRRWAVRIPGQRHHPGERLHQRVVSGAVASRGAGSEGRDGAVDDRGVALAEPVVTEAELLRLPGPEAAYDAVGLVTEAQQRIAAGRGLEAAPHAALVAVDRTEHGALAVDERRHAPGVLAAVGRLDLDDVGAEVSEDLARQRAGEVRADVQHPQAGVGLAERDHSPISLAMIPFWISWVPPPTMACFASRK